MTAIAALLTRTRAAADQRQAGAQAEYLKLVQQAASGAELQPDDVAAKLDNWGIAVATFEKDVGTLVARMGMKVEVDRLPALLKRLAVVQSQTAAARREYDIALSNAEAKLLETLQPLGTAEEELTAAISKAEACATKLVEGCSPELVAARDDAQRRASHARTELNRQEEAYRQATDEFIPSLQKDLEFHQGTSTSFWTEGPQYAAWIEQKRVSVADAKTRLREGLEHVEQYRASISVCRAEVAAAEEALSEAQAALSAP